MSQAMTSNLSCVLLSLAVGVGMMLTENTRAQGVGKVEAEAEGFVLAPLGGGAAEVGPLVTSRGEAAKAKTMATVRADAKALTVTFQCTDTAIKASDHPRDDKDLWKDDCVEVFLDVGHTHEYFSEWAHVLLTAGGQVMDERGPVVGFFTSGLPEGGDPRIDIQGLETKVEVNGQNWTARIVIPWASVGVEPKPGTVIGFNLNRTDSPDEYQALYPTHGIFLAPDRWGHLVLTDPAVAAEAQDAQARALIAQGHKAVDETRAAKARLRAEFVAGVNSDTPSVRIGGVVYGAQPDERGPLGGGKGYVNTFTKGDIRATTLAELIAALKAAKAGQVVFIPGEAVLDATDMVYTDKLVLEIPGGVTLASDRGVAGSQGATIMCDAFQARPMIRAMGPGVTITGLRVTGPDTKIRGELHARAFAGGEDQPGYDYYYRFPNSDGISTEFDRLTVANCEISGWSHSGVYLTKGADHSVHHCYIHHNHRDGLGYGVSIDTAFALIERNIFEYNRHDIAGTGRRGSGYEARHNLVRFHTALSHHFDMHGGSDRKDGSDIAGDYILIHHNAFYGTHTPVRIRGVPVDGADIHHNWFPRNRPALFPEEENGGAGDLPVWTLGNTKVHDNAYGLIKVK